MSCIYGGLYNFFSALISVFLCGDFPLSEKERKKWAFLPLAQIKKDPGPDFMQMNTQGFHFGQMVHERTMMKDCHKICHLIHYFLTIYTYQNDAYSTWVTFSSMSSAI